MANMAEINIDDFVNYKAEYTAEIKKAKITGDQLIGLCPFHDDRNDSFSVDLKTGRWHCFAEDRGGNFLDFYAELHNMTTKDAYKEILEKYGQTREEPAERGNQEKNYTLAQYAFEKRLPEAWLKDEFRLQTTKGRDGISYLKIPYYAEDGSESTYRKRYASKDFRWKYGSSGKIILYGEWNLAKIRSAGYAVLVEGESDTQSLWYMGINALGVPGASMFKPKMADTLQDLKIYIHKEPDQGGETFFRKVTDGLRAGGFIGEVYKFSCSTIGKLKDPSDVYMQYGQEDGAKRIGKLIRNAEPVDLTEPEIIPEAISGAPVNLRQPEGWIYSEKGISRINKKTYQPQLVCRTPIILTQRLRSIETGEEKMEIAFKRDGEWHRAIFPRSTIFTARGITVLADLGCTVTSENAKEVVRFLSALEAENIDIIDRADSTGTFGWQPGRRFIPGKEDGIVIDVDPNQQSLQAAYCQNGSLENWIETMRPHRSRDKFRFILAASFAAPLLKIIKQRTFFVYNWGGSKGGKTAALKAALSAWGDPERLMVNFNATQVGLERTAAFFCDLPLGIDERQLAGRNQEGLEKIIYMISSGTGKIRGSKSGGIQATQTWRTVALATGEEPLATETTQTGVSTRTLEIYGAPFDDEKSASRMHQDAPVNCGWAGPAFIEKLIECKEQDIIDKYDEMSEYVSSVANGTSGSHVAGVAAVALADAMIDTWIFKGQDEDGLQIDPESWGRAKRMAENILKEQMAAEIGDVNENAVQYVTDWVESNQAYFGESTIGQCFGMMSESGNIAYIFPSTLNQALTKAGFSARKTLKYMADHDLITSTDRKDQNGKRMTVQKRFDGRTCRFIEFHIGKLAEKDDDLDADEEMAEEHFEQSSFEPLEDSDDLPFD